MVRRGSRVLAIMIGLPVLVAAVGACGDDGSASSNLSDAAKHGQQLAKSSGCAACHGADGQGGIGPAWTGVLGSSVTLTDGTTVVADEAYLTRSIKDPQAQVVDGFAVSMPANNLSDQDIADLVAYIVSLKAAS
jgi:cytochrome c553